MREISWSCERLSASAGRLCSVELYNKTQNKLPHVLAARATITHIEHAYNTGSRPNSLQTTNQNFFFCAQNVHHYYTCNGCMFTIEKSSLQICQFTREEALRTDTFFFRYWTAWMAFVLQAASIGRYFDEQDDIVPCRTSSCSYPPSMVICGLQQAVQYHGRNHY
jgi:hypothetical protein